MSERVRLQEPHEGVRLQELRDFTVQIRVAGTEVVVGTGVVVSMGGQVVTCAHVVKEAIGAHPCQAGGAEVGVYFPQARGGEVKARRADLLAAIDRNWAVRLWRRGQE